MKHKYLTPWDHSPVFDLAKSSGCHINFYPKVSTFKFNFNGQLLCTSSELIYDKLNKQFLQNSIYKKIFLDKKRINNNPRYIHITKIGKPKINEIEDLNLLNETILHLM